jgi:hypothetical protein
MTFDGVLRTAPSINIRQSPAILDQSYIVYPKLGIALPAAWVENFEPQSSRAVIL